MDEPKDFYEKDVPERLQDDPLVSYFRCRYKQRDDLLATFKERFKEKKHKFERIEQELTRVDQLRSRFEKSHEFHMKRLRASRATWIRQAKTRCLGETQKVEEKIAQLKTKNDEESREQLPRQWYELNILKRVPNIKTEDSSMANPPKTTDSSRSAESQGSIAIPITEDHKTTTVKSTDVESSQVDPDHEFMVNMITLKKVPPKSSYVHFEMEKCTVNKALDGACDSPLKHRCKRCEPDTLRYFHFPANNMDWIERAIARYNDEEIGEYDYRKATDYRQKSSNFLCREFWTGRQHGGKDDPIHARHMRSHCSHIPSDASPCPYTDSESKNPSTNNSFIMFMPYLHWETDRKYRQMAAITKRITKDHQKSQLNSTDKLPISTNDHPKSKPHSTDKLSLIWTQVSSDVQPLPFRTPLGRYLFHVAEIYSHMDSAHDRALLKTYLCKKPPLHGRRTLDQSYYWKLEDTGPRDQDQVVYRGTMTAKDSTRTTRVIMVDQLWLYVLDDHTIITSFPRRWGRNKPDHSAVHNAIRARLAHLRGGEINSVYDLALIIINQCSTVFFDRTKLVDERPDVFDIFANAIGHVSERKSQAFEVFWGHLRNLDMSQHSDKFESFQRYILNINPEGVLLREAHDIMDELRMMRRIYDQQLSVATDFLKHLQDLHDHENPPDYEFMQGLKRMIEDINKSSNARIDQSTQTNGEIGLHNGAATVAQTIGEHLNGTTASLNITAQDCSANRYSERRQEDTSQLKSRIPKSTLNRAKALIQVITIRRDELQDYEDTTKDVSNQLEGLLSLKQQQASLVEADAALAQGRSIMLFTVVTIIFLPLSFMSSVFGMNASELSGPSGGIMPLRHQFTFMFPISVAIIIPTLCLAFSAKLLNPVIAASNRVGAYIPFDWLANLMSLLGAAIFALCFEYSGLHYLWRFYILKSPPVKGVRKVWNIFAHKRLKWDANALANRRKHWSKEIELRRQLQENTLNERREKNRIAHA